MQRINEKILKWSGEETGIDSTVFVSINNQLNYLAANLFYDYEPTIGPFPDFIRRFESWIDNVKDENDQKVLFKLAARIFYVGREEFTSLHRTSFNSIYKRWLCDILDLSFNDENFNTKIEAAIKETWFCPVTDSFRINQFYHVNSISNNNTFRPDWRSLKKFGDKSKILEYITLKPIKYIVLLEDFVGSGTQSYKVLKYAAEEFSNIKILFIPLIIYPQGLEKIRQLAMMNKNFTVEPVISIDDTQLINKANETYNSDVSSLVNVSEKYFETIRGNINTNERDKIKEFGYNNTGGVTVMFTNAPNNALPAIYYESDTWKALFKRIIRD